MVAETFVESWEQVLTHLPSLGRELLVTKSRQARTSRPGSGGSGGSATRLVFNVGAMEIYDRLVEALSGILIALDRAEGTSHRYEADVARLASKVARRLDDVKRRPDQDLMLEVLLDLYRRGVTMVDIPPDTILFGQCSPACPGTLVGEQGSTWAECSWCRRKVEMMVLRDERLAAVGRYRAPLSTVVAALSKAGCRITLPQAKKWAQRKDSRTGKHIIEPCDVAEDGVHLYEVGEVYAAYAARHP